MSKLLINEPPLQVLPSLAKILGLNEALVLQQVHYWLTHNTKSKKEKYHRDGKWWTWNTVEEWQENNFPFWSCNTIRRILESLRKPFTPRPPRKSGEKSITLDKRLPRKPLLITGIFNKKRYDRTLWYTIDYDELARLQKALEDSEDVSHLASTAKSSGTESTGSDNGASANNGQIHVSVTDTSSGSGKQKDVAVGNTPIPETTETTPETTEIPPPSLFSEPLPAPSESHIEGLRQRMGGASDPLGLLATLEERQSPAGRPEGWKHVDGHTFRICLAVAEQFKLDLPVVKKSYPESSKEMVRQQIDKWTGGAILLLEAFAWDEKAVVGTLTAYRQQWSDDFTVASPKSLVNVLPSFRDNGSKKQKRGKRLEGTWTQAELDTARMQSLATPSLETLYGGDFLNMTKAEQSDGLMTARPRLLEWARASTGDEQHAIYQAGGPEVLVEKILRKELGEDA